MKEQDIAGFVVRTFGEVARKTAAHLHGKVLAVSGGLYDVQVNGHTMSALTATVGTYGVDDWVTVTRMGGGQQAFQIIGLSAFMGGSS